MRGLGESLALWKMLWSQAALSSNPISALNHQMPFQHRDNIFVLQTLPVQMRTILPTSLTQVTIMMRTEPLLCTTCSLRHLLHILSCLFLTKTPRCRRDHLPHMTGHRDT